MAEGVCSDLRERVKSLLISGEYSDLVITCGIDRYNVHKAIVCPQSGFFQKAEKFPVGKESAEGEIHLPEDDPAIVKLLIAFLYDGEYDPALPARRLMAPNGVWELNAERQSAYKYDFPHTCVGGCPSPNYHVCPHHSCIKATCGEACVRFICNECVGPQAPKGDASQLVVHAKMYEIGDKYDVAALKELSRKKFALACQMYWDSDEFCIAAEHALNTTPESDQGLREILHGILVRHPELLQHPSIEKLLTTHMGFAFAVLKRQSEEMARSKLAQ